MIPGQGKRKNRLPEGTRSKELQSRKPTEIEVTIGTEIETRIAIPSASSTGQTEALGRQAEEKRAATVETKGQDPLPDY